MELALPKVGIFKKWKSGDLRESQNVSKRKWDESVFPFVTPFVPSYAANSVKDQKPFNGKPVDYTHEREWRVAKDFPFQYSYISFVVLKSYIEMNQIPTDIVEEIGIERFIFMDTYRQIEELWPTHLMDQWLLPNATLAVAFCGFTHE